LVIAVPQPSAGAEDISLMSSSLLEDFTDGSGDLTLSVGLFELAIVFSSSIDLVSSQSPHRPSDLSMNLSVINRKNNFKIKKRRIPVEENNEEQHQIIESVHLLSLDSSDSRAPKRLVVWDGLLVPRQILKLAQVLSNDHHLDSKPFVMK